MATRLVNIWANTQADIQSNDSATATLRLANTDTGTGQPGLQVDSAGLSPSLLVTQNSLANGATIAPLRITASLASQAAISFQGVFISTASINPTKAAFVIPVKLLRTLLVIIGVKVRELLGSLSEIISSRARKGRFIDYVRTILMDKDIVRTMWRHIELGRNDLVLLKSRITNSIS